MELTPYLRRRGLRFASVALFAISLPMLGLFVAQRSLIYQLDPTPVGEARHRIPGAQDLVLRTDEGLALDSWLIPPTGIDRHVAVLYCPGNGGNRLGRVDVGAALAAEGFTVLLLDYRGAGGNPGSPSQSGLLSDARAGVSALADWGFERTQLIYVGESIGTGVASLLAAELPPAGVLLRSPFTSLTDVVHTQYPFLPSRLLRDTFRSSEHLRDSQVPVRILYGDADAVVAPELSVALSQQVGNLQSLEVLSGIDHNDSVWFGPYLAGQVAILEESLH